MEVPFPGLLEILLHLCEQAGFDPATVIRDGHSKHIVLQCCTDVGRILRTFKIKKNVEVTDNGKDDF